MNSDVGVIGNPEEGRTIDTELGTIAEDELKSSLGDGCFILYLLFSDSIFQGETEEGTIYVQLTNRSSGFESIACY